MPRRIKSVVCFYYNTMHPLTVLIGIVMGSAVSLTVGLLLTWIVLLFLPEYAESFAAERAPLARAILIFAAIAAVSAAGFYAEIKQRRWRALAYLGIVLMLAVAVWTYWPTGEG